MSWFPVNAHRTCTSTIRASTDACFETACWASARAIWMDGGTPSDWIRPSVGWCVRRSPSPPGIQACSSEGWASLVINRGRASKTDETAQHYNLGHDLFEAMLDRRLVCSCGYWDAAETLDTAQEAKLDLVCRKLGLEEGDRVLDVGCGWGSFLAFAAERYGGRGLGITISEEQATYARKRVEGLPVEIRLADYRTLDESEPFDHVVSLGMFEHVGVKNYRTFFEVVDRNLKGDGLLMLHTIGGNTSVKSTKSMAPSVHFSQLDAPLHRPDRTRDRGAVRHGRLAQLRCALRSDPDGLARAIRRGMAVAPEPVRRTLQEDVDVLSPSVRRSLSGPWSATLADRALASGRPRRVRIRAMIVSPASTVIVAIKRTSPRSRTLRIAPSSDPRSPGGRTLG